MTLSLFQPGDAAVLYDRDHDPEHRRRFDFPDDFVPSLRHSQDVISRWEHERGASARFAFAVRDAETGDLLGGCELCPLGKQSANLSYWTYPAHRLRGVASRAVALVCQVAFQQFRFRRLEVVTDTDNISSRRLALRNGFKDTGLRDGRVLYIKDGESTRGSE